MGTNTIIFLTCICILFIFGRIFIVPIKLIMKLIFNSLLGGIIILIINVIGINFGIHIGINLVTSLVVGILGVPGAIFLLILTFF